MDFHDLRLLFWGFWGFFLTSFFSHNFQFFTEFGKLVSEQADETGVTNSVGLNFHTLYKYVCYNFIKSFHLILTDY